jgi:MscS family membrane protein
MPEVNVHGRWRSNAAWKWRSCLTSTRRQAGLVLCVGAMMLWPVAQAVSAQLPRPTSARSDTATADSTAAEPVEASPGSPRVAVEQFLTLARAGSYGEAAAYLDVPDSVRNSAPLLARRLKAVLDRHLWVDLERVSPLTLGDTTDGLPPGTEQIGTVRSGGASTPIRMTRQPESDVAWRFSRATVDRIPALYAALPDRWILEHLPDALLRPGPFELLRWQWLALPLLLLAAYLLGTTVSRVARAIAGRIASRTHSEWDDAVLSRLGAPLTAALTLVAVSLLLPLLSLYPPASRGAYRAVRVGFFLIFFWSIWRLIDVARMVLSHSRWAQASPSSRALLPLGARVAKVIILAIALVAVLSLLGYPVASLIAGLGLGGLALALAAQKTVENLFGAFSLGVDQPFREGDFVKIEDFVGHVEAIGLRSTRFRTLDRTIVSIPNGRLAEMRLESFTARDRLRLATIIGLVYETTAEQMREVLGGFERVLRAHPKIWPDAVVVRFREFADSSLNIEIMAWFQTSDWGEFQGIRQEILIQFMDVVEKAGTSIAFPTRTIHFASESIDALKTRTASDNADGRRDNADRAAERGAAREDRGSS